MITIQIGPHKLYCKLMRGIVTGTRIETKSFTTETLKLHDFHKGPMLTGGQYYTTGDTVDYPFIDLLDARGKPFSISLGSQWKSMQLNQGDDVVMAKLARADVEVYDHVMLYNIVTDKFWTDDGSLTPFVINYNYTGLKLKAGALALVVFLLPMAPFNLPATITGITAIIAYFIFLGRTKSVRRSREKGYRKQLEQRMKEILRTADTVTPGE